MSKHRARERQDRRDRGVMNRNEYAKHRGVTWRAVEKRIRDGLLSITADGELDVAECDAAWELNEVAQAAGSGNLDLLVDEAVAVDADGNPISYKVEHALHEKAKRELAEMKLAQAREELIPVGEVRRVFFARTRAVRDSLLSLPNDIGADVAAETDPRKVIAMLDGAIRSRLMDLTRDGGDGDDDPEDETEAQEGRSET
jgi:hypothetical protein